MLLASCFGLWAQSVNALSSTITECREMKGYAYFKSNLQPKDDGFVQDGIKGGQIILNKTDTGYDLLLKDTAGFNSVKENGGKIMKLPGGYHDMDFLVNYSGATEIYNFILDSAGNGEVIWVQNKDNPLLSKAAVYRAECKK
jgi:hypothetical protein